MFIPDSPNCWFKNSRNRSSLEVFIFFCFFLDPNPDVIEEANNSTDEEIDYFENYNNYSISENSNDEKFLSSCESEFEELPLDSNHSFNLRPRKRKNHMKLKFERLKLEIVRKKTKKESKPLIYSDDENKSDDDENKSEFKDTSANK